MKKEEKQIVLTVLKEQEAKLKSDLQHDTKLLEFYSERVGKLTKDLTAVEKQIAKLEKQIKD